MVYIKNTSFQSYKFYIEKLNPEPENSLILEFLPCGYRFREFPLKTGLKDMITRDRGHLHRMVEWKSHSSDKTVRQNRCYSFVFGRVVPGDVCSVGSNSAAGIFPSEYFHGWRCSRECQLWFFSSPAAIFSQFSESYAAAYWLGGSFLLFWEWYSEKKVSCRIASWQTSTQSRLFFQIFLIDNDTGVNFENPEF